MRWRVGWLCVDVPAIGIALLLVEPGRAAWLACLLVQPIGVALAQVRARAPAGGRARRSVSVAARSTRAQDR